MYIIKVNHKQFEQMIVIVFVHEPVCSLHTIRPQREHLCEAFLSEIVGHLLQRFLLDGLFCDASCDKMTGAIRRSIASIIIDKANSSMKSLHL